MDWTLWLLIVGVVLLVATTRKGSKFLPTSAAGLSAGGVSSVISTRSMTVPGSASEVFRTIMQFSQQSAYKIEAFDETSTSLVLNEGMNVLSNGCFYPIQITQSADALVRVEVGIQPKITPTMAVTFGKPLIARSHERCFTQIHAALLAAGHGSASVAE
jgi:hypothetical protein